MGVRPVLAYHLYIPAITADHVSTGLTPIKFHRRCLCELVRFTFRAFEWLERVYTQGDTGLIWLKADPHLKGLERDPRWAAFLKKMRLPL